jgi:hypothetical protein
MPDEVVVDELNGLRSATVLYVSEYLTSCVSSLIIIIVDIFIYYRRRIMMIWGLGQSTYCPSKTAKRASSLRCFSCLVSKIIYRSCCSSRSPIVYKAIVSGNTAGEIRQRVAKIGDAGK